MKPKTIATAAVLLSTAAALPSGKVLALAQDFDNAAYQDNSAYQRLAAAPPAPSAPAVPPASAVPATPAVPRVPTAGGPDRSSHDHNTALEAQLESARQRLDEAARQVAQLSVQLEE